MIGAVCIAVAAFISVLIKESLDTLDPEASLPTLVVTQNDQVITDVYRAGYEWRYFATVERRAPQVTEADLPLVPVDVAPQACIALNFSSDPSSLHVYRTESQASPNYLELVNEDPSVFYAPTTPGVYVYKVIAEWGWRGEIQYYFSVRIVQPAV